jgi:hypothetical protein
MPDLPGKNRPSCTEHKCRFENRPHPEAVITQNIGMGVFIKQTNENKTITN